MDSNKGEEVPRSNSAAVGLAYEIALSAYVPAREQWENVHRRLDALLSFVTTLTIATPVAAQAVLDNPDFASPLLIGAGVVYALLVLIALVARSFGAIRQISPRELHEQWLHLDEREFKLGIIDWSGRHSDQAQRLIARKSFAANVMALLFVAEALTLVAWVGTTA